MKYTDRELEDILNKLIASTRSPRGRFSAASSYPQLEKKLNFRNRRLYLTRTFAAAAAVVLLCLSVWTAYLYMQPATIQTVSTLAETRTVHLPDGTSVTLNHYSSLSYPERFKSDNREVELSGEAYFEVSKDPKHPFIVQTETIDVQVLGTHFNVDAYPDNPDVKTTLLTGSVAVSNKNNSIRMVLKPNEVAIYNKVEDFAMEFYADGRGRVVFAGYSVFHTGGSGMYAGNDLLSDEKILQKLSAYVPQEEFIRLRTRLEEELSALFGGFYHGYLGVDMMICHFPDEAPVYRIHPCVEINLRMNMGVVARLLTDRYLAADAEGAFRIDYYPLAGQALEEHRQMSASFPLSVENNRVCAGYLPLVPVTPQSRYRAFLLLTLPQ